MTTTNDKISKTEKEGSTSVSIGENKINVCDGCPHLRYDHDWIYDAPNGYYCGKNWDTLEEEHGYKITPKNCPVEKK
jgi:hypothetical protein